MKEAPRKALGKYERNPPLWGRESVSYTHLKFIFSGVFVSRLGRARQNRFVDSFGEDYKNNNGDRFLEICDEYLNIT